MAQTGIVYHKGLIKVEDAPKTIEDLVNPKYKGMLVMGRSDVARDHASMAEQSA